MAFDLQDDVTQWYATDFEEIWHEESGRSSILSLDYETLAIILSSEQLNVKNEYIIWKTIHDWICVDKASRHERLPYLIYTCLRFGRLDRHFIDIFIFECEIFTTLPEAAKLGIKSYINNVLEASKQATIYNFNLFNSSWVIHFCPRGTSNTEANAEPLLVCIDKVGVVDFYDASQDNWHTSPLSLHLPNSQEHFNLALLGTKGHLLYALGGTDANSNPTSEVWSRHLSDPTSQWSVKPPMKQGRVHFASVVLNNNSLYAIGGQHKGDNSKWHTLKSVERFDVESNRWSDVAPLAVGRQGASAAVLNGKVYLAGGKNQQNELLRSVEQYDPQEDCWRTVAPMSTGRYACILTPFAGRLWALGGCDVGVVPLSTVESYDPETNTWQVEAELEQRRWRHTAAEFNGELYVVGGKRKKGISRHVEKYSPGTGWMTVGRLTSNVTHPTLITVDSAYKTLFTFNSPNQS